MGQARDHTPKDARMANARDRIARAHGHLHAVLDMIDEERDAAEVLQQLAAVRAALDRATAVMVDSLIEEAKLVSKADAHETLKTIRQAVRTLA